jgi:hypothetical protein
MSSSTSSREKVEGKRVQEDVGRFPSKFWFPDMTQSLPPNLFEKVEGKRVQGDVGGRFPSEFWFPDMTQSLPPDLFEMVDGKPVGDSIIHYEFGETQRWQFPGDPYKILVFGG